MQTFKTFLAEDASPFPKLRTKPLGQSFTTGRPASDGRDNRRLYNTPAGENLVAQAMAPGNHNASGIGVYYTKADYDVALTAVYAELKRRGINVNDAVVEKSKATTGSMRRIAVRLKEATLSETFMEVPMVRGNALRFWYNETTGRHEMETTLTKNPRLFMPAGTYRFVFTGKGARFRSPNFRITQGQMDRLEQLCTVIDHALDNITRLPMKTVLNNDLAVGMIRVDRDLTSSADFVIEVECTIL